MFYCIICPFYSLTISSYLDFNAKIIPVVLLIPHNEMHFTFERFDLRSMKIFTFDDDFNLLSLLYLGEVISTQWLKLPSSDEISWLQCKVNIVILLQTAHCKWKWSRVALIFDRYSIKSILLRQEIFDNLKFTTYVKQMYVGIFVLYVFIFEFLNWSINGSHCIIFLHWWIVDWNRTHSVFHLHLPLFPKNLN